MDAAEDPRPEAPAEPVEDDSSAAFATALREAITRSGLSLRTIRARLAEAGIHVSVPALSTWQSGARRPFSDESRETVRHLEVVLGLEPDALLQLLARPRLQGRRPDTAPLAEQTPAIETGRRVLAALGFPEPGDLPHEVVVAELVTIDPVTSTMTIDFRIMVRVLVEGTVRLPAVYLLAEGEPDVPPEITAVAGCTVGRRVEWTHERAYGAELILESDLAPGDVAICDYQVRAACLPDQVRQVTYSVSRRAQLIFVQVQFAEDVEPVECERYTRSVRGGRAVVQTEPTRINADNRIQATAASFGPGTVGLRWHWADDPPRDANSPEGWQGMAPAGPPPVRRTARGTRQPGKG